jgi:hypothetical protein
MLQSNTVGHLGEMLSPRIRAARKRPGGSNVGRYPHVKTFAGPSGGSPAGSYPINTLARAKSALKLAHNAPDPDGIRQAVFRKYPQLRPSSARA